MKYVLVALVMLFTESIFAQFNKRWVIGVGNWPSNFANSKIEFNSSGINTITNSTSYNPLFITTTTMNDSAGDILFYTNGICIFNAVGDTMENSDSLSPSSWTYANSLDGLNVVQAVVALPLSDSVNHYILFHYSMDTALWSPVFPYFLHFNTKIYFSIIDMSYNGGLGKVTEKNVNILNANDTLSYGGLTCCRHANGRDWWLVAHGYHDNDFYVWLLTPQGVQGPTIQSIGPVYYFGLNQCKFSPDGMRYAVSPDGLSNDSIKNFYLFDFDRCTGLLSNQVELSFSDPVWSKVGLEFSANSRYLYCGTGDFIYQWDTWAIGNVQSTSQLVASCSNIYNDSIYGFMGFGFGLMQRAIDNRIYISSFSGIRALSVINSPDSIASTCNFQENGIQLPTFNSFSIPNQVNFDLGPVIGSVCDSLSLGVEDIYTGGLVIYPNPSIDNFTITLTKNYKITAINIMDITGKIIYKTASTFSEKMEVNTKDFAAGVYLVQVKTKDFVETRKVIVVR